MKKQGKVKLISVTDFTVGKQVYYKNHWDKWQIGIIKGDEYIANHLRKRYINVSPLHSPNTIGLESMCLKSELKQLVVEYYEHGNMSVTIKTLPLKFKQWQSAIDNGEVNSDKLIEFEIKYFCNSCNRIGEINCSGSENSCDSKAYAKIIPAKKKLYTEEEAKELCKKVATDFKEAMNMHTS